MKTKTLFRHLASAALLTLSIAAHCQASYIFTVSQSGNNVVGTGSGTINTTALTADGTLYTLGGAVIASVGALSLGPTSSTEADKFTGASGPSSFGSGSVSFSSSGSGDVIVIYGANGWVYLPYGYTSGAALSGTDTWDSTTISGLGLTPGTYSYTWGTGGNADSLTVDIQGAAPEPGTVSLLAVGVLGLALNRRRTRKRS